MCVQDFCSSARSSNSLYRWHNPPVPVVQRVAAVVQRVAAVAERLAVLGAERLAVLVAELQAVQAPVRAVVGQLVLPTLRQAR